MARLAVAVLGGVIGSLIPGIGWSIGFLVGNVIGGILFPPKGPDGPRLQNLEVLSSAYGQFINQGFGTVRVPGNMIWGLKIKEHKHSAGKGLGGGGASGTTYTYTWTGAIAVGRGPITSITRIWADTKLVYDGRGTTAQTARGKKKSLKFRIYKGTETQLPDPAMEHDVGVANAVAHRGMAYVLFDDIPLEDYGNRVPSWTFEVTFASGTSNNATAATQIIGGPLSGLEQNSYIGVDWDRDRFFTVREGSGLLPESGIRKYNMRTMQEVQQGTTTSIRTPIIADPYNGDIYTNGDGGNTSPIKKWDADGLVNTSTFGVSGSGLDNEQSGFVSLRDMDILGISTLDGVETYVVTVSLFNDIGVLGPGPAADEIGGIQYIWGKEYSVLEARAKVAAGPAGINSANAWIIGHDATGGAGISTPIRIYKLNIKQNAAIGVNLITGQNDMVQISVFNTINPNNVVATWAEFNDVGQFLFDESDNTVIIGVSGGPTGGPYHKFIIKYDISHSTVVWKTQVDAILSFHEGQNQSRLRGSTYAYIEGSFLYQFDTTRGTLTKTDVHTILSPFGAQIYDSDRDAILLFATVSGVTKPVLILLSRSSAGGHGVGEIIQDFCQQAGLDPTNDVDVTGINDSVRGYLLNAPSTARAAIEPLGFAFLFDGVEIDYKLRFIKRGQNVAVSITEEDLVLVNEETGSVIDETRQQELELPVSVSIVYLDYDKDYQQGTARVSRISLPTPAMYSKNESTTTLPMVLVADEAKKLADRAMWSAWTERIQHKYRLSWEFLKFDPSDVVQITLNNGVVIRDRVVKGDIGADFSLEWESVSERSVQYSTSIPASGGDGFIPQVPPASAASRYFVFDMPYVRDQDNIGDTTSCVHDAGSSYGDSGWAGMIVSKSVDGSSYNSVSTLTSPATWGIVTAVVGDTSLPFQFDTVNSVIVSMVVGEDNLSSCTREEALNGQNWAALLNETTGVVELFTFTTVTQNADGSYTLSDLRRGLRGTEIYTGAHISGEAFVLLDEEAFSQVAMGFDELNANRYFLGVPVGDVSETGSKKTIVATGRDKKPWAPVNERAAVAGSDIAIAYDRRARFGGGLVDGTGAVALFETTEAYEIDIYNALGTTVLRTLTATSESVTYLAANITTDFGGIPATLTLAVYQMSSTVGRGFGQKHTVDVTP